jgi:hypothetical protein
VGIRIARLKSEIQEAVEAEDYAAAAAMKEELLELKRGSVKRMFEQEGRASQQEGSKGVCEEGDDDDGEAAAVSAITPVKSGRGGMVSARKPKYCVLSANERLRDDEADDSIYYSTPRLTLHCDEMFATKLQGLYSERLVKGSRILDLGASCATLLPDDLNPSEVRVYATLPNSFSLMFLMKETRGHSRGGGHLAMHEMFGRLDSMCGPRVHTATFTMLSSPA